MWEYVNGRWSGAEAARMYAALRRALVRAFPGHLGAFTVIEDNDPTGYKSRAGIGAKAAARIVADSLPKRSPDLNVLDYSLWHAINVRMREQERAFPARYVESAADFKRRLRRVAMRLPRALVERAVGSMTRRCNAIVAARGGLIVE